MVDILKFQSEQDSVNLVVSRNVISFSILFLHFFFCFILGSQLYLFFFFFYDHKIHILLVVLFLPVAWFFNIALIIKCYGFD